MNTIDIYLKDTMYQGDNIRFLVKEFHNPSYQEYLDFRKRVIIEGFEAIDKNITIYYAPTSIIKIIFSKNP